MISPISNARGIAAMLFATASYVVCDTFMKLVTEDGVPPFEVLFLRGIFAVSCCAGLLVALGQWRGVGRAFSKASLLRAGFETASVLCYIVALAGMGIADAIAIIQTAPLLFILLIATLGRERIGLVRIGLIAAGFVGALLVAQPDANGFTPAALLAFAAALGLAIRDIAGRAVSSAIPALAATLVTNIVVLIASGVGMALTAIEMLTEAGALSREVVLLLNSDEEVGSPISRPITEAIARDCGAVFVLEPAQGLAYKTARKGTGDWRIEIAGQAAHAGVDFERGASALRELARVIETVSGWTDLKRGLTVSVGVAGGGTKTNVIPAEAWAEVDVRIARKGDGARIERKFARLKAADKRCLLTLTGGINRPPMERTRGTVKLYQQARALAEELGIDLAEAATGGASDGNFTSALGVPTLDGMGAVGEGAHARHESVVLEHLAPRTALLAGMIAG